ncbi:TPA: hypothetical protein ACW72V_001774 [Elizabethkingia anophelis]
MVQNYDQTNIYANPGTGTDTDNTFGAGNITNENSMGLVCPPDYRVPSKDEWDSFIQANTLGLHTLSKISTGSTVYDSGIIVTYGGKITLFLPLAGYRSYISDPLNSNFGKFFKVITGGNGIYWSSTAVPNSFGTSVYNAYSLDFGDSSNSPGFTLNVGSNTPRRNGASLRCIKI